MLSTYCPDEAVQYVEVEVCYAKVQFFLFFK